MKCIHKRLIKTPSQLERSSPNQSFFFFTPQGLQSQQFDVDFCGNFFSLLLGTGVLRHRVLEDSGDGTSHLYIVHMR